MKNIKWPNTPVYWIYEDQREEIAQANNPELAVQEIGQHADQMESVIESYEHSAEQLIMAFSSYGRYEWRCFESTPPVMTIKA